MKKLHQNKHLFVGKTVVVDIAALLLVSSCRIATAARTTKIKRATALTLSAPSSPKVVSLAI